MPDKISKSSKNPLVSKKSSKSKKINKELKLNTSNKMSNNINMNCIKNIYNKKILFINIIICIIGISILSYIFYYLKNLQNCVCFQDENKNNEYNANINYLMIIEGIIIISNIFILISSISMYITLDEKIGGSNSSGINTIFYLFIILYLIIYGLFVYNVYKLNKNIVHDCECAKHPIRYILYLQAIGMFIFILLLLFLGLSLFIQ
jgi:hypothetical protein